MNHNRNLVSDLQQFGIPRFVMVLMSVYVADYLICSDIRVCVCTSRALLEVPSFWLHHYKYMKTERSIIRHQVNGYQCLSVSVLVLIDWIWTWFRFSIAWYPLKMARPKSKACTTESHWGLSAGYIYFMCMITWK